jgi:hypothetical protein
VPGRFITDASALGAIVTSQMSNMPVEMMFPVLGPDTVFKHPEGRLVAPDYLQRAALGDRLLQQVDSDWGYVVAPGRYQVGQLRASFVATRASDGNPASSSDVQEVAFAVPGWFAVVNTWLCAWLKLPSRLPQQSQGTTLHFVDADGHPRGVGGIVGMTAIMNPPAASLAQIVRAFYLAGRNVSVPLEHQLLVDARTHHWAGDYRRAVIDAGTAAEVALATTINEDLRHHHVAASFQELAIRGANGVVGLVDLYQSMGHTPTMSRGRVADRLARRRNDAAHAGVKPSSTEASNAIAVADAIVHDARPLPSP